MSLSKTVKVERVPGQRAYDHTCSLGHKQVVTSEHYVSHIGRMMCPVCQCLKVMLPPSVEDLLEKVLNGYPLIQVLCQQSRQERAA
jgi:hypothetical protein